VLHHELFNLIASVHEDEQAPSARDLYQELAPTTATFTDVMHALGDLAERGLVTLTPRGEFIPA
jgi:hypothetical protein